MVKVLIAFECGDYGTTYATPTMTQEEYEYLSKAHNHTYQSYHGITSDQDKAVDLLNLAMCSKGDLDIASLETELEKSYAAKFEEDMGETPSDISDFDYMISCCYNF